LLIWVYLQKLIVPGHNRNNFTVKFTIKPFRGLKAGAEKVNYFLADV